MAAPINVQVSYGPELPLKTGGPEGYYNIRNLVSLAKQNFKNLLLTSPGERTMIRDFGVGLKSFLFELNTPNLRSKIRSRIKQQARKYVPYIEVGDIVMSDPGAAGGTGEEIHVLKIHIGYYIKPLGRVDELDVTIGEKLDTVGSMPSNIGAGELENLLSGMPPVHKDPAMIDY